jgi:two-component system, NtrC family, response regulator AtoC
MKVLIVDDEENIRESLKRLFELEGIKADTSGDGVQGQDALKNESYDVTVIDLRMPRMDGQKLLEWIRAEGIRTAVIMVSAHGEIVDAVAALKSGADDYLVKPFDPAELILKAKALSAGRRRDDLLEAGSRTAKEGVRLVGRSQALDSLRGIIGRIANSDATVLLTGESGTGKEVIAREIHRLSPRSAEPFVAVNIGGVHEQLMESELFGHERGAFTGAESRKIGLFELAGSGTLFLDEIGEMPMNLQVKLLRVIQDRTIRRLGGSRDIPVAARIVSATNRDIEARVASGEFREDLYYRLNVVRIAVPPLRDRMEDIPILVSFLLERIANRMGVKAKAMSAQALASLTDYDFPGNIRELENILERSLIYASGAEINAADLGLLKRESGKSPSPSRSSEPATAPPPLPAPGLGPIRGIKQGSLEDMERDAVVRALERRGGNRTKAAADLGISRRTILNKIKAYGLS